MYIKSVIRKFGFGDTGLEERALVSYPFPQIWILVPDAGTVITGARNRARAQALLEVWQVQKRRKDQTSSISPGRQRSQCSEGVGMGI